jgi:hypothetical protein
MKGHDFRCSGLPVPLWWTILIIDLGVDRFIDLLVWDLIHEKLKVEGVL